MGMKKLHVRINFLDESTQRKATAEKTFVMKKWREDDVAMIAIDVYKFLKAEGKKFTGEDTIEFANDGTFKMMDAFLRKIVNVDGVTGTTKCDAVVAFVVPAEETV